MPLYTILVIPEPAGALYPQLALTMVGSFISSVWDQRVCFRANPLLHQKHYWVLIPVPESPLPSKPPTLTLYTLAFDPTKM